MCVMHAILFVKLHCEARVFCYINKGTCTVYMFTNELRCPTLYAVTVEHEVQLKVLSNYKYMYVPVCILISTYQNLLL